MTIPSAETAVDVLDLKGGEIIVLRYAHHRDVDFEALSPWLAKVNATLAEQGKVKVHILILIGAETVEALDETQMRSHGWVREGRTGVLCLDYAAGWPSNVRCGLSKGHDGPCVGKEQPDLPPAEPEGSTPV